MLLLLATVLFLKDTKTPLKGGEDVGRNPRRFYGRTISLDDIKLIKNAMNMTINDVLVGVTQAALSRYLNRPYVNEQGKNSEEEDGALTWYPNHLPDRLRFRAACAVNLRPDIGFKPLADMMAKDSKCRWGNYFSFIVLPFSIGLQTDPLVYLKRSKAMMARKKHSYHALLLYFIIKMAIKVFGTKAAATIVNRHVMNLTTCVSNIIGPMEEVSFRGHPIAYIALSSYGHSQTEVNVEDHVVVPYMDPEKIGKDGEGFIDEYTSRLTMNPMDRSRPLWDIHILNVKTSDAEAVGVVRTHHTLGDGTSMVSLLLACAHKISDPIAVSITSPSLKRRGRYKNKGWFLRSMFTIGSTMTLIWNTIVDMLLLFATLLFLKDTKTHLKGGADVGSNPKRFYHRTISLDDIKLIKNAMNMTINDVLVGITQASLSSYLNQRYDTKNEEDGALIRYPNNLPGGIRFRAGCTVNLRSEIGLKPLADMMVKDSKCRWGNYFSYIVLPFSIGLQSDPLDYLKLSKSMMDRKRHSYHAHLAYMMIKICQKSLGAKVAAKLFNRTVINTTTSLSNVIGPMEEISFDGNPITYIATNGYGHSQALLMHFMSYAGKMTISLAVDPTIIPDPHKICDDMEQSLKEMKAALWERGLL
ncbi:hypothetical protein F2Q70_00007354 [Brassica cretica]|uniref:Diacylglycerol O-acyltransferase n=1 Tax=Brassica cretica TaxID=69181 RepID=A0A8S9M4P1_BRACR|nr:hypothetical protein F2Q70_00007354 [Brassica cretica]